MIVLIGLIGAFLWPSICQFIKLDKRKAFARWLLAPERRMKQEINQQIADNMSATFWCINCQTLLKEDQLFPSDLCPVCRQPAELAKILTPPNIK